MPADKSFLDRVMDLLAPLGDISSRAMFGGYGIFHQRDMFALIYGSSLYFKVNDSNRAIYQDAGSRQFVTRFIPLTPMPYYEVPTEVLEDMAKFREWARMSINVGHATSKKKRQ